MTRHAWLVGICGALLAGCSGDDAAGTSGPDAADHADTGDGQLGNGDGDGDGDGDANGSPSGVGDGDGQGSTPDANPGDSASAGTGDDDPFQNVPDAGDASGACMTQPETTHSTGPALQPSANASEIWDGHCQAAPGQIFPPNAPWNQSVRARCVDPRSDAIVRYLDAVVTGGQTFRIDMGEQDEDYGFQLQAADGAVQHNAFTPTDDFFETACDRAAVPVPAGGRLEGEANYSCSGGDCHLLVFDTEECRLYEMWRADNPDGAFNGGCLAVWDTTRVDETLRGLSCTSADAAGLPIMPLLFTPHEIESGAIQHALRFILPNNAVQRDEYVRPATHNPLTSGEPASGPDGTQPPPYGVRLRLRESFDASGLSAGAQVIAAALKEYGMFHADGGNVTFIASNANGSPTSWSSVGLGPNDLRDALSWTDFEVVSDLDDTGSMATTECTRTPLSEF